MLLITGKGWTLFVRTNFPGVTLDELPEEVDNEKI